MPLITVQCSIVIVIILLLGKTGHLFLWFALKLNNGYEIIAEVKICVDKERNNGSYQVLQAPSLVSGGKGSSRLIWSKQSISAWAEEVKNLCRCQTM